MKHGRTILKLLFWFVVAVLTIWVFRCGQAAAFAQRGYKAVGGEYLLLTIPIWIAVGKGMLREFTNMRTRKERTNDR